MKHWASSIAHSKKVIKATMTTAKQFLQSLREEVLNHPAVNHPFLERVATTKLSKEAFGRFGLQLYPHCHMFITYMERLLISGPDSRSKIVIAQILLDEYGEDANGIDHPGLFRRFLRAAGADDQMIMNTTLDPEAIQLVRAHMQLCGRDPFLVGFGAIGPGHELPIPKMFNKLCSGMRAACFSEADIEFFSLHSDHDVEHAKMMEDAIQEVAADPMAQVQVRAGAMASLDARGRFWNAVEKLVFGGMKGDPRPEDMVRIGLSRVLTDVASSVPWARQPLEPLRMILATTLTDFA